MASFDKKINNGSKVDWRTLVNGSIALYHDKDILKKDGEWLKESRYQVITFDFNDIKTPKEFHENAKQKLNFPSYYGENISAFSDCLLHNLNIPENGGLAIVFENFDEFYQNEQLYAHEIMECLDVNSRRHLLYGDRLIILIQLNSTNLVIEDVGSHTIMWNVTEFFRGF